MKIEKVTVSYGELRSKDFANTRYEVGYSAIVEENENPNLVRSHLLNKAKSAVRREFGDDLIDVPFF